MSPREKPHALPLAATRQAPRRVILLAGTLCCALCLPLPVMARAAGLSPQPGIASDIASDITPDVQETAAAVHNIRAAFLRTVYDRVSGRLRTLPGHCPAPEPERPAAPHAQVFQYAHNTLALHCQGAKIAWRGQSRHAPVCWRVDAGNAIAHLGWQARQALRQDFRGHMRHAVQRLDGWRHQSTRAAVHLLHAAWRAPDAPDFLAAEPPRLDLPGLFALSPRYQLARMHIRQAAGITGIDPYLLEAVTVVESRFNPRARSPKGALGLMQLMPATAQRFGVRSDASISLQERLADPATNVLAGARYLRYLMQLFPDRLDLVLAGYNAGEGAVRRHGYSIPPYRETRHYVRAVMDIYDALRAHDAPGGAHDPA